MDDSRGHQRLKSGQLISGRNLLIVVFVIALAAVAVRSCSPANDDIVNGKHSTTSAKQLWSCSMHPQVIQEQPGRCPICHMELTPLRVDETRDAERRHLSHPEAMTGIGKVNHTGRQPMTDVSSGERRIKYWWDPMVSPPYISDKPGKSPMGMDLVPVYEDEAPTGAEVTIDPWIVQNMGVRTAVATKGSLERSLRLVGYLSEAEPNIRDMNLRVSGWVTRLYANTEGMPVKEGAPLFELYSSELSVAVDELIAARRARNVTDGLAAVSVSDRLLSSAVQKLLRLGIGHSQVESLQKLEQAPNSLIFTSPISGHITKKAIVEGSAVKAGDSVLRIVDHSALWLDAQAFENQLPVIRIGSAAQATISPFPGETFQGKVIFIHPHLDPMTRTTTVRFEVQNEDLKLRPGMYGTVNVEVPRGENAILVPREAVIDSGEQQVVFVVHEKGRFEPRQVRMGASGDNGLVEIASGINEGEEVVTSGQFLLDSESRLREAIQKFLRAKQQDSIRG